MLVNQIKHIEIVVLTQRFASDVHSFSLNGATGKGVSNACFLQFGSSKLAISLCWFFFFNFEAVHHTSKLQRFLVTAFSRLYRLEKLITLAFIVFEWLKIIEPNSTTLCDPRIRSKSVHPIFYTAAIGNAFLFINCLISNFSSTFYK